MEQFRDNTSQKGVKMSDIKYSARVYNQKALKKQVERDLKIIGNTLLPKGRRLTIERVDLMFDRESYPFSEMSLEDIEKAKKCFKMSLPEQYQLLKMPKYIGYIEKFDKNDWHKQYRLFSDTEMGVWWELINFYLFEEKVYPAI